MIWLYTYLVVGVMWAIIAATLTRLNMPEKPPIHLLVWLVADTIAWPLTFIHWIITRP